MGRGRFQDTVSVVRTTKGEDKGWSDVRYHVFDVPGMDAPFRSATGRGASMCRERLERVASGLCASRALRRRRAARAPHERGRGGGWGGAHDAKVRFGVHGRSVVGAAQGEAVPRRGSHGHSPRSGQRQARGSHGGVARQMPHDRARVQDWHGLRRCDAGTSAPRRERRDVPVPELTAQAAPGSRRTCACESPSQIIQTKPWSYLRSHGRPPGSWLRTPPPT